MTVQTFGSQSSAPGTTGTFPSTDTVPATGSVLDSQMGTAQQIASTLTAAQFTSDYLGGSTTQAAQFVTSGKINQAGIQWIAYKLLPEADRVSLQDQMVTAGVLTPASVSGMASATSDSAFKSLLGIAQSQNTTAGNLLALANDNGIGPIQQQLSTNIAAATKEESAPLTVDVSNPSTIEAQANQAWTQTVGYAPSADQLKGMVSLIQGQDTSAAEAPRAAAKAEIAAAQSEESTLNKLGPDGVDTVVAAYHSAVNGLNVPGAGTTQGPAIPGQTTSTGMPIPEQVPAGGSAAATPTTPAVGSSGAMPGPGSSPMHLSPLGPSAIAAGKDTVGAVKYLAGGAVSDAKSVGSAVKYLAGGAVSDAKSVGSAAEGIPNVLHNWLFGSSPSPAPAGSSAPAPGPSSASAPVNKDIHLGNIASTPAYGGMFALSPSEWAKAQTLTPAAKNYTAGNAPQSVQMSAFTNLLLDTYQKTGSWSSAIEQIASGTPVGTAKGSHLSNFATDIANQVNSQIESAQTQVAAPITEKVTQPDVAAEANQAAKASDPIGYAASNYSSWAGEMSQMLYGSPTTNQNPSADTFTGPVSPGVAASAPAAA